jgi:hypothetical protein
LGESMWHYSFLKKAALLPAILISSTTRTILNNEDSCARLRTIANPGLNPAHLVVGV